MQRSITLLTAMVLGTFAVQGGSVLAGGEHDNHSNHHNNNSPSQQQHRKCDEGHPTHGPIHHPIDFPTSNPKGGCGNSPPGIIVDPVRKPPTKIIDPVWTDGTAVVRDHRHPTFPPVAGNQGGVTVTNNGFGGIVRDHRNLTTTVSSPIVRDHRGTSTLGSEPAGVVNGVSSVESGLEHAAGSAVNAVGRGLSSVGSGVEHAAGSALGAVGDLFGF